MPEGKAPNIGPHHVSQQQTKASVHNCPIWHLLMIGRTSFDLLGEDPMGASQSCAAQRDQFSPSPVRMTSLGDDQLTIGGERWSLGRLIGKGGFASVYEAVASGSGLQAAVKVVDLSQQSTWASVRER